MMSKTVALATALLAVLAGPVAAAEMKTAEAARAEAPMLYNPEAPHILNDRICTKSCISTCTDLSKTQAGHCS